MFKYFLVLIFEIYKSSILLIPKIITGNAQTSIISITTSLNKPQNIAILANSITLTPGTITIDVSQNNILVLWFNPKSENSEIAGILIKGKLEKLLREDNL